MGAKEAVRSCFGVRLMLRQCVLFLFKHFAQNESPAFVVDMFAQLVYPPQAIFDYLFMGLAELAPLAADFQLKEFMETDGLSTNQKVGSSSPPAPSVTESLGASRDAMSNAQRKRSQVAKMLETRRVRNG